MKLKITLFAAIILTFTISCFSQIQIAPNKIIYKRVGKKIPDHKKTFEVTYPVILDSEDFNEESNLIKTLSYWRNFEITLEENLGDYTWLTDLFYKVNYNKKSVLDVTLTMEGVGAYPSASSKTLVIDTKTGKQVSIKETFVDLNKLAVLVGKAQTAELKKAMAKLNKESAGDGDYYLTTIEEEGEFTVEKLNEFSVSDKGITFLYDYGFPHVALALQPEGRYFFTWTQLKPFINPEGLLGQFVR